MNPQISIIVPVYKVERYLSRCIDSILNQSFSNFELLLVDDGSPDNSGRICDEYAQRDTRIRVFHKENGGVSSARNLGLNYAKGEWIYFVDSDDEVNEDGLFVLMNKAREYDADCVTGSFEVCDEKFCKQNQNRNGLDVCMNRNTAIKYLFTTIKGEYQGYLWTKIFKKSIIDRYDINFKTNIYFNEDRLFCVEYLCHCYGNICYVSVPTYKYYIRSSSAMGMLSSSFNPKLVTDFEAFLLIYELLQKERFSPLYIVRRSMIYSYNYITKQIYKYGYVNPQVTEWLKKELCTYTSCYERILWMFLYHLRVWIKKMIGWVKK